MRGASLGKATRASSAASAERRQRRLDVIVLTRQKQERSCTQEGLEKGISRGLASPRIAMRHQTALPPQTQERADPELKKPLRKFRCKKGAKDILGLNFPLLCLRDLAGTKGFPGLFW